MKADRVVVVFAKHPTPGAVKTRMCPPLTPEQAAALYAAMLDDVPVRAADVSTDPVAPQPIVVPLPTGLETGALALAAMAARRWWTKRRTR